MDTIQSVAPEPPVNAGRGGAHAILGLAVLGGELAVPCTRNPLKRD